jgi:MioC protein
MLANVNYIAHHAMQNNRKLKILVGTMTNTAEYVAQAIEMDGADRANRVDTVEVLMMDRLDIGIFEEDALYVICTSTYGAGDVPDNAKTLYESLANSPRFLGSVCYCVIALGDSASPQTFCLGGHRHGDRRCGLVPPVVADGTGFPLMAYQPAHGMHHFSHINTLGLKYG